MRKILGSIFLLLAAGLATLAVPAQEQREKVARVSISQGDTSYQRGMTKTGTPSARTRPS